MQQRIQLKEKDLQILMELRKNGRAQLTEICKNTKIPVSTIYDRIKSSSEGIISKHVTLVNFDKLGFSTRASICLKCGKNSKTHLLETMLHHQNVNSIYKINNGYDFMIEVIFKNVKELEEFVEKLDENFTIKEKAIYYVIDEIVREVFFSDHLHLSMV